MNTNQILALIASTAELFGGLMIAYAALSVHGRFLHEHKVDDRVFTSMKKEQVIAFVGVGFLITGYIVTIIVEIILT